MRGHWWKIAKLELTLAMKDRESLIWSLAAPIAMAWLFGTMFGSDGPPAPTRVRIETGLNSERIHDVIAGYLKQAGGIEEAPDGIEVVLPDSLLERMKSGHKMEFRVIQGDADATRAQAVAARVREMSYWMTVSTPAEKTYFAGGPEPQDIIGHPLLGLETETRGTAPRSRAGRSACFRRCSSCTSCFR
jgi:hypothetical protein